MQRFWSALCCTLLFLAVWCPLISRAQTWAGDGLRGDYYDGMNFVQARRDAVIDFYWPNEQPMRGVPAEQFTVRWTGWLVPPTTDHYVLHLAVDDGARLWLDGKQVLDEWRGQPLSYFDVPLELQAGPTAFASITASIRLALECYLFGSGPAVLKRLARGVTCGD